MNKNCEQLFLPLWIYSDGYIYLMCAKMTGCSDSELNGLALPSYCLAF